MNPAKERVRMIVARTLGIESDGEIDSARMGEHPNWDSMHHIQLVMAIEEQFGLRFQSFEIPRLADVSAIADAIARHEARKTGK